MSDKIFAIISTGGKQYYVKVGQVVELEQLAAAIDETVQFPVLLVSDGSNLLSPQDSEVTGQVVKHSRAKKIVVFRKNRRTSGFTRKHGHRQMLTTVLIKAIKPAVASSN